MESKKIKDVFSLNKEGESEPSKRSWINFKKELPSDISKEQLKMLMKRFERIDKGETELKDWDEVKKKYTRFE
ncbi:MAG: hypothetical protein ABI462_05745 [Ignavibacteria bacterium]